MSMSAEKYYESIIENLIVNDKRVKLNSNHRGECDSFFCIVGKHIFIRCRSPPFINLI